jgi:hypothetical protein
MGGPSPQATVLLVDKDEARLAEIARELDRAGFAVVCALSVGDAAAVLAVTPGPVAAVVADTDPSPLLEALGRRGDALLVVHTRGLLLPARGMPTYSVDGSTPAEAIAGLLLRLCARPAGIDPN